MTTRAVPATLRPLSGFEPREIDDSPTLLAQSYRLRYQVYCLERQYLSHTRYPSEQEIDQFDDHAVHVGAVNAEGVLAGTARLVRNGILGFPLARQCALYLHEQPLLHSVRVVEVSRLSVSRVRRNGLVHGDVATPPRNAAVSHLTDASSSSDADVFLAVLTALYGASKRMDATHWLMAIETSLHRIIRRYGLPVRQIGPECDYFGPVAPHVVDLAELDAVIQTGTFPALDRLVAGQQPHDSPRGVRVPAVWPTRGSR